MHGYDRYFQDGLDRPQVGGELVPGQLVLGGVGALESGGIRVVSGDDIMIEKRYGAPVHSILPSDPAPGR